jgi:hypothetical protein
VVVSKPGEKLGARDGRIAEVRDGLIDQLVGFVVE